MLRPSFVQGLLIAGVAAGFYWLAPPSEKDGAWANIVLRNWHDYGLFNLDGKMIWNPGGIGVTSAPKLYGGHQPWVLYLAYFLQWLTGSPGDHGLLFFVLFCWSVWASLRLLFADWSWGPYLAFAGALSPGLLRSPLQLDTLAIPVPLGLAVFTFINRRVARNEKRVLSLFISLSLLSVYVLINWTTVFALGPMLAAWFVVWIVVSRRPCLWIFFSVPSVLCLFFVSWLAMSGKSSEAEGVREAAHRFFNTYLFGAGGYGGMSVTWLDALRRVLVANGISLLPFLAVFAWAWHLCPAKNQSGLFLSLLPLGIAILSIGGMRNYFAAHPWMTGSVFVVGLSLALWTRAAEESRPPNILTPPGDIKFCFGLRPSLVFVFVSLYCLVMAGVLRLNAVSNDSLMQWLKGSTSRSDIILYSPLADPWIAAQKEVISGNCDRVLESEKDFHGLGNFHRFIGRRFFLTSRPLETSIKTVWTEVDVLQAHRLAGFLEVYRRYISKRDSREVFQIPDTVYLYRQMSP